MTDQAMSPLRPRMIEDMTVRNFVAKTQSDYIRSRCAEGGRYRQCADVDPDRAGYPPSCSWQSSLSAVKISRGRPTLCRGRDLLPRPRERSGAGYDWQYRGRDRKGRSRPSCH